MTDDSRFRAPRAHGQSQPQAAGGRVRRTEDPLAELARLIGQEDPFADFVAQRPADARAGAQSASGAQRRPQPRDARTHDPRGFDRDRRRAPASRPSDSFDSHIEPGFEDSSAPAPRSEGRSAYAYGGGRTPRADDIPAVPTRSLRSERAAPRPLRGAERHTPAFDDHDDGHLEQPRTPRDVRAARRAPMAAPQEDYEEYATGDYDPEYDDDAYLPAHGDEFYEEAPRRRIGGWTMIALAAVAAIIVGSSALFAYRTIFVVEDAGGQARVISPDAGPTKMVPESAQAADQKSSRDRIGELAAQSERIVSREESPIDQSRIPQGVPADRIPSGTGPVAAAPQFAPAPTQTTPPATVAPATVSTEPRRVRTVTVRSDGTVVPNTSNSPSAAPAQQAPGGGAPLALQGGNASAAAPSALPPQRPATTTSAAPLRGDNPWSTATSPQPTTQAALPPPSSPPPASNAPAPAIAVQTPPPAGSYVVQVAAQKSEAEAQASWQTLQQRYANVLGGQQAQIRRVNLGERGVFYRAQVGPFNTRAQASEVCQSLRAAGGECVIQRN